MVRRDNKSPNQTQPDAHIIRELEAEIERLEDERARIVGSISWRLTLPLRLANGAVWYVRQKFRIFVHSLKKNPRLRVTRLGELKQAERLYERATQQLTQVTPSPNTKAAVVIHLYYAETWTLIADKLENLKGRLPFDLFVTVPSASLDFAKTIKRTYPKAHIFEVPNRGRDVLPFIQIACQLESLGYEYLLKLHSKRSPHYRAGKEWFSTMLEQLLPESPSTITSLVATLRDPACAIVGPGGQYLSLRVNYDSNAFFLLRSLRRAYSREQSRYVNGHREDYGFFAGTMFWARLDALHRIFQAGFEVGDFEHETGPIDGTLAHGLERVFCVGPELEARDIYEINGDIRRIAYKSYNIPEWSDIHPKNKKKKIKRRRLLA